MNLQVFKDRLPELKFREYTFWECALGVWHVDGYGAVVAKEEELEDLGFRKVNPPESKSRTV